MINDLWLAMFDCWMFRYIETIDCSVLQGSVLGRLKCVAYTKDFPSVIEKHKLDHHLYADKTQIADHLQLT